MKRLIAIVAACVFLGTLAAAPVPRIPDDPAVATELKALEGKWQVIAIFNFKEDDLIGLICTIKGREMTVKYPDIVEGQKSTIKLDPKKEPKQIDITPQEGQKKSTKIEDIYQFKKERLYIYARDIAHADKGRPTEFKGGYDAGVGCICLERVKE